MFLYMFNIYIVKTNSQILYTPCEKITPVVRRLFNGGGKLYSRHVHKKPVVRPLCHDLFFLFFFFYKLNVSPSDGVITREGEGGLSRGMSVNGFFFFYKLLKLSWYSIIIIIIIFQPRSPRRSCRCIYVIM